MEVGDSPRNRDGGGDCCGLHGGGTGKPMLADPFGCVNVPAASKHTATGSPGTR